MEWLDEFPTMERQGLRDLKKAIDLGFRDFSRAYGDGIEGFFEPLLYFLVWLDKLLVNTPWPVIIVGTSQPPKLAKGTQITPSRWDLLSRVEVFFC